MLVFTPMSKPIRKKTTTTTLQTKTVVSDTPSGVATIRDELFREFSTLLVSFAGGLIGGNWRFSVSESLAFSCFKEGLLLLFDEDVLVSSRCSSRLSILEDWGFTVDLSGSFADLFSFLRDLFWGVSLFLSALVGFGPTAVLSPSAFVLNFKKCIFGALSFKLKRWQCHLLL